MRVPKGPHAYNVASYHINNITQRTPSSIINNLKSLCSWHWQCFFKLDQKGAFFFFFFLSWCLSEQGKRSKKKKSSVLWFSAVDLQVWSKWIVLSVCGSHFSLSVQGIESYFRCQFCQVRYSLNCFYSDNFTRPSRIATSSIKKWCLNYQFTTVHPLVWVTNSI